MTSFNMPCSLRFSLRFIILLLTLPTCLASAAEPIKKALFIGLDGTRFDAIEKADTPHLDALMKDGIHSPTCLILGERFQDSDTVSGPGWASILTGVWADKHGTKNNSFEGRNFGEYPHFFARLKQQQPDARTASFVTWAPIHDYIVSAADVSKKFEDKEHDVPAYDRYDTSAADEAVKELTENDPDAVFFYVGQTDVAGHAKGFHPTVPEYIAAIDRADKLIGRVVEAVKSRKTYADENWLIVVTSDHGGKGTNHGGGREVPEILHSFLIVSGPAAQRGTFDEQVYLVDAPVTVLTHLGVKLDDAWKLDGRAVGLK